MSEIVLEIHEMIMIQVKDIPLGERSYEETSYAITILKEDQIDTNSIAMKVHRG